MRRAELSTGSVIGKPALDARSVLTQLLLACGILSALLYATMLVFVPMLWPGYDSASYTVSELFAIGAPTRALWVSLAVSWTALYVAFGWGVWRAAGNNRTLRGVGCVVAIAAVFSAFWPPMHQREVLGVGGATLTDTLHDTWTLVNGLLTLLTVTLGALSLKRPFRHYSIVTLAILVATGALTAMEGPRVDANLSTPWIGVWERIHLVAWLLWVSVLAVALLRREPCAQGRSTT